MREGMQMKRRIHYRQNKHSVHNGQGTYVLGQFVHTHPHTTAGPLGGALCIPSRVPRWPRETEMSASSLLQRCAIRDQLLDLLPRHDVTCGTACDIHTHTHTVHTHT